MFTDKNIYELYEDLNKKYILLQKKIDNLETIINNNNKKNIHNKKNFESFLRLYIKPNITYDCWINLITIHINQYDILNLLNINSINDIIIHIFNDFNKSNKLQLPIITNNKDNIYKCIQLTPIVWINLNNNDFILFIKKIINCLSINLSLWFEKKNKKSNNNIDNFYLSSCSYLQEKYTDIYMKYIEMLINYKYNINNMNILKSYFMIYK